MKFLSALLPAVISGHERILQIESHLFRIQCNVQLFIFYGHLLLKSKLKALKYKSVYLVCATYRDFIFTYLIVIVGSSTLVNTIPYNLEYKPRLIFNFSWESQACFRSSLTFGHIFLNYISVMTKSYFQVEYQGRKYQSYFGVHVRLIFKVLVYYIYT